MLLNTTRELLNTSQIGNKETPTLISRGEATAQLTESEQVT
jgi:hypothetical protein